MKASEYTREELERAAELGVCLVCLTPRDMRKTTIEKNGHTRTRFEMFYPCGHDERDQDTKLDEML